ncbi:tRNA (5-methylaminomethyl-2-thiouridine)(34)-methyltransferase MnmD [uncultured Odoribacter sp.]|uniref:tRNA (5-methylaminomethyl-2-thiouridine)(34)-methyltransferase MnmD n=1 Tax=uncultured Odoribacter sp. TaxID=876416 RepID=UPI0026114695|nr:tRNA (5-methylaminomethyl-2-thiouridine)(34)-methyltransferase MnmD [uncultured Odoribacter sp.]
MKRQFIHTEDGSTTLYVPALNEHYHSIHGAIQESVHIFIHTGIEFYLRNNPPVTILSGVNILEAGFGTGLNAYLSFVYAEEQKIRIQYHSIEKYPLSIEETKQLNYKAQIPAKNPDIFDELHSCPWERENAISPVFSLHKYRQDFREIRFESRFDIIFFDAFNPEIQPYLWTEDVFQNFYKALKPQGILVTYCVKGIVKQALRKVGFTLKKLPGPPGKREILRAQK